MMLYQVNRLFFRPNLVRQFFRNVHRTKPIKIIYPLTNRSLLKITGNDSAAFLQGLITNDMEHLEGGAKSMYAMFLNHKGRVLYDTVIYKWDENSYMLECDRKVHDLVLKHLKIYKLKRSVEIENTDFRLLALITPIETEIDTTIHTKKKVNIYKDPRLADLGHRMLVSLKASDQYVQNILGEDTIVANDDTGYRYLRYKLGVSEGADEINPGASFPLEANCDYLHGVSFHKGCYIGQELTARVHHTGVVRKRIMPLKFIEVIDTDITKDTPVSTHNESSTTKIGKFINFVNDYGLGLVKYKEALESTSLKIGTYSIQAVRPSWWPVEASKEKVSSKPIEQ